MAFKPNKPKKNYSPLPSEKLGFAIGGEYVLPINKGKKGNLTVATKQKTAADILAMASKAGIELSYDHYTMFFKTKPESQGAGSMLFASSYAEAEKKIWLTRWLKQMRRPPSSRLHTAWAGTKPPPGRQRSTLPASSFLWTNLLTIPAIMLI
jgi:hypothetical protein